jgi:hypothetical protein
MMGRPRSFSTKHTGLHRVDGALGAAAAEGRQKSSGGEGI